MRFISAVILAALLAPTKALAVDCGSLKGTHAGVVQWVSDGDTAQVLLSSGESVSTRLYGTDTPESSWKGKWPAQAYSKKAKSFTKSMIDGKKVKVEFSGVTTYKRCVGEIFKGDKSVSLSLIENGLGWWYKKYSPNRSDLARAEQKAKSNRIGLWTDKSPTPPWEYRRQ